MTNETITLVLTEEQEKKLYNAWKEYASKTPPYARFQLRPENCVITCYQSHKTVFQGKDASVYASPFISQDSEKKQNTSVILPQAGSDEVGTGDYFGPVCVCAAIVDEKTYPVVKELGIRDSKKLRDTDILKAAPALMKVLPYSLLIVDNQKYNEMHQKYNLNALKALLHNQAYVNLEKKNGLPELKVIDQFAPEKSYYRYLQNEAAVIRGIHFETKAEDKYPAVGSASVIARYAFLIKMDEMDKKYQMHFCLGAGSDVDACAKRFVEKYGFDALVKTAKLHFKNTEKTR